MNFFSRAGQSWSTLASDEEPRSRRRRKSKFRPTVDGLFCAAFLAGLAWTPLYLGSNRPLAWGINGVLFGALATGYGLSLVLRGRPHPVHPFRLKGAILCLTLVSAWIALQMGSFVYATWAHPLWIMAGEILERPLAASISIDRDLTYVALLRLLTAASVFWLGLQLARDEARARTMLGCLVLIVSLYAGLGLTFLGTDPGSLLGINLETTPEIVSSTFANRNSFATYAGLGLVGGVALMIDAYRRHADYAEGNLRQLMASVIETTGGRAVLFVAAAFVILAALLLSGSRAGILSTGLGMFVLVALVFTSRGGRPGRSRIGRNLVLIIVPILIVVGCFIGFGDVFIDRVSQNGLVDENRARVAALTLISIRNSPWLGYGYDTFQAIFPLFRDDGVGVFGVWDKAHNTYLELLQGLGVIGGAVLLLGVLSLVWACFVGAWTRQRNGILPAAAASASALVGVHALVDFSLEIQAVTLTYMTLLGMGVAQAQSSRVDTSKR